MLRGGDGCQAKKRLTQKERRGEETSVTKKGPKLENLERERDSVRRAGQGQQPSQIQKSRRAAG